VDFLLRCSVTAQEVVRGGSGAIGTVPKSKEKSIVTRVGVVRSVLCIL
jgi:hypothetical protein